MDAIESKRQQVWQAGGTAPRAQCPPPPPPPRSDKQQNHTRPTTNSDVKLSVLKFGNEGHDNDDGDVASDYDYVTKPMKVDEKKTSNGCDEPITFSEELLHDQHCDINENGQDGTMAAGRVHDHEGGEQLNIWSDHEKMGDVKEKRSGSKSSTCLKSMTINTIGSASPPIPEQHPCDTHPKPAGSAKDGIHYCRGKSPTSEDKEKFKGKVLDEDGYEKLIRETRSSTHESFEYQKLITATMEPRITRRQHSSNPDLALP